MILLDHPVEVRLRRVRNCGPIRSDANTVLAEKYRTNARCRSIRVAPCRTCWAGRGKPRHLDEWPGLLESLRAEARAGSEEAVAEL